MSVPVRLENNQQQVPSGTPEEEQDGLFNNKKKIMLMAAGGVTLLLVLLGLVFLLRPKGKSQSIPIKTPVAPVIKPKTPDDLVNAFFASPTMETFNAAVQVIHLSKIFPGLVIGLVVVVLAIALAVYLNIRSQRLEEERLLKEQLDMEREEADELERVTRLKEARAKQKRMFMYGAGVLGLIVLCTVGFFIYRKIFSSVKIAPDNDNIVEDLKEPPKIATARVALAKHIAQLSKQYPPTKKPKVFADKSDQANLTIKNYNGDETKSFSIKINDSIATLNAKLIHCKHGIIIFPVDTKIKPDQIVDEGDPTLYRYLSFADSKKVDILHVLYVKDLTEKASGIIEANKENPDWAFE